MSQPNCYRRGSLGHRVTRTTLVRRRAGPIPRCLGLARHPRARFPVTAAATATSLVDAFGIAARASRDAPWLGYLPIAPEGIAAGPFTEDLPSAPPGPSAARVAVAYCPRRAAFGLA